MSKKTDERTTPSILFDPLHAEFNFEIDLAATHENTKLPKYYSRDNSAFNHSWNERCFCNPPYSQLHNWVGRAYNESRELRDMVVVMILPCDTSTKWFHDFIWNEKLHETRTAVQLRFPKGRFKFGKYTTSPQFATMIAIFNG